MTLPLTARLARRSDRERVLAHLGRDPLANLFLIDLAARIGARAAPGEVRAEVALALSGGEIAGVAGLRPSVVFDAAAGESVVEALLPFLEMLAVGLVKSPAPAVDVLWRLLQRPAPPRAIVDRHETAYVLRRDDAHLAAARPGVTVRAAEAPDLEALVVAARESLREEGRPDPFVGDVRSFRRWVRGRVPRARVVVSEGRVVSVGYADVQRPEGWLLQGVYTWPEARGRGFAGAGVSELCRTAFAAGADHVQLAVVEGNEPAIRLYEALGFKPFSRLRTILFTNS